jgi:flagellar basal body-associated protein FliL
VGNQSKRNPLLVALAVLILVIVGVGFWYLSSFKSKKEETPPPREGVVGSAEEVSEAVPEIVTNPGESVPEINPVDRANPFKYNNPLR